MANVTEEKLQQQVAELKQQLDAANRRIKESHIREVRLCDRLGDAHCKIEAAEIGQPQGGPAHMDSIMRLQQLTQRWACNISRDDQEHIKTVLKMLGYPAPVLPWPDETGQSKGAPTE